MYGGRWERNRARTSRPANEIDAFPDPGTYGCDMTSTSGPRTGRGTLPAGIWMLGMVSMFMDISSEMIHALLPVFLVTVLGASTLTVGLIEGVAEAIASITKVFSGVLSDWFRRRKLLTVIGYGLAAATKPMFALAGSIGLVVTARFLDRVGKGIRGAPRDALIADIAPPHLRGSSYGLRQSLDTVGAFIGPLAAIALMALTADRFRTVFWIAAVPAAIAMVILVLGVHEPARTETTAARTPLRLADLTRFTARFWTIIGVAALLTLARFSEAFLVLRAQDVGLALTFVPLVMVVMNIAYSLTAYPAGIISDRAGRSGVITAGFAFLVIADLILAFGATIPLTLLGVVFWGLHMGFTQGIFATLVADNAPAELRGSAFGFYNLALGVAMLAASVIAGALWDGLGPRATFLAGAAFTILSYIGYVAARSRDRQAGTHRT